MAKKINPWGTDLVEDYDDLFKQFGLQHLPEEYAQKFSSSRLFRRNILFAHRGYDAFVKDAEKGKPVAVMSGIKPSSEFHLGSKLTAEEIIFNQKRFGAKVFYAVADNEALADNGLSYEESHPLAVDNVADLLALGLDPGNAFIYKQSKCLNVLNTAQIASKKVTMSMMNALYGHQDLALYLAVLTQIGDILQPQLDEFGGPKRVVVPVGVDQDPHIRLTRDVAPKLGFLPPSSTYHRFFRALNGETKMSKRDPLNVLSLNDSAKDVKKKVGRALTGGRATVAEQREKGAEWWKCVVYELMLFHFEEDDAELAKMREDCEAGNLSCGECKARRIKKIQGYLAEHQEKKSRLRKKAEKLLS